MGIIAGSIVAVLCVLLLFVCCMRNVRKRKDDASSESKDFVGPLTVNIERGMTLHMLPCLHVVVLSLDDAREIFIVMLAKMLLFVKDVNLVDLETV